MRTITKNSGYIGKLTSAINVKNTLINDGVVSMPSSISATTITKQQALNYKDYNDKFFALAKGMIDYKTFVEEDNRRDK